VLWSGVKPLNYSTTIPEYTHYKQVQRESKRINDSDCFRAYNC
jgi:hypothetical protein